jgi:hypothetical protein
MLLKQGAIVKQGKTPHEFFRYLASTAELLSSRSKAKTVEDFLHTDHIMKALAIRACFLI